MAEAVSGAVLGGLIQFCRKIGPVKLRLGRKFEHLHKKFEYFIYVRDAIEKEKIKQLLRGYMPRKECKAWLERAEEIVHQVNDILKYEGKSSELNVLFQMKVREQLMTMLDEIADQLEKSIEYGLMINAPHKKMKRTTGPKIQGEKYGSETRSDMVNLEKMSVTESKQAIGSEMSSARGKVVSHSKEMQQIEDAETLIAPFEAWDHVFELIPMQTSEAGEISVAGGEGRMTPEIADKYEAASDIISAPAQQALLVPDLGAAASIKAEAGHASIPLPGTETLPKHETGFEFTPAVPEGLFQGTDTNTETEMDVAVGTLSHRASEIVPVPFESEEEDQTQPESRISIKISAEPFIPMVRQEIILSSDKEEENSIINEVKVERQFVTPGGHVSPSPVINATRSIYHTAQKILGCIRHGTAKRIGIYGTGGIGKTTVLKVLFSEAGKQKMFDSIIWVTVSRYSNRRTIQNQVAKQLLNCPADSHTNSETILNALKSRSFLLLLDDVWEEVDLDALGIPNPDQENGCRIIVTTRSVDVCHIMSADTKFEMEVVSREEAWKLFHDQVGGIIDSPEIMPYAQAIVAECGGLPLTIVVTGRALGKENDVSVWKHALRELLLPSTLGKHGNEAVIQQLKFSYDKLKARDVKDCFLYCALLQEDHEVNISELINYFIDEGLVAGNSADACDKGHKIVKILLEASLLESTDDGLSVKMHDVIRDLASAVMSPEEEGCQFLVRADLRLSEQLESPKRERLLFPEGHQFLLRAGAGLTEPPSNENWEQAKMIFLMDNELFSLPENPSCPKLLTLFLQRNNRLRVIPMSFFDGMPHLQVLNLSKTRIKSLPQSLFKLNRLKVLLLRDCECFSMLPPKIGALESLELLDLHGTEIYNLPNEIGKLAHLKHMLASFYGTNNRSEYVKLPSALVSDGIISRLLHLKELRIAVYPGDQRWSRSVESITKEVSNLEELQILDFYFPEVELLKLFIRESPSWNGKGLTKFNFVIGHNVKRIVARVPDDVEFEYNQQDRCLRFVNGETLPSAFEEVVKEVLSRTTAFYLDHHLNVSNLSEFGLSNINALEFCILRECPEIQTVVNGEGVEGFVLPLLKHLSIHYLWKLRTIWEGPVPPGSLSRLRFLSIHTCPELPFVLKCTMLQSLYNLEVLVVEDCEAVKDIIFKDDIDSGDISLPKLKILRLHYLPNLVSIWKGSWPSIEHISFYNCPKLENLYMSSSSIYSIKEIKAEKEWWDRLKWEETELFVRLQVNFTEICYEDL